MAYLDDAVKQCPTLRVQFFDVKLCQPLSLFLLECLGIPNIWSKQLNKVLSMSINFLKKIREKKYEFENCCCI